MANILFAGEQVSISAFEIKGFDYFGVNAYKEDGQALVQALIENGHEVTWIKTCTAMIDFPESLAELQAYDAIILSDIGSNTLLFHPEMLAKSVPHPNRLKLLEEFTRLGGGLMMIGGWMSFAGIDGRAKFAGTPVEQALPINCHRYDDRQEIPESIVPEIVQHEHPVLHNMSKDWPYFLGYNQVMPDNDADIIVQINGDPLVAVKDYEQGRSAVFTSDCAPHWGPACFLEWDSYSILWNNIIDWLTKR